MKDLVKGSGGPGFSSPEEALHLLENFILPSFDQLIKLENEKKILGGGLPVGDRAFVFVIEASSNDEVDNILRGLPMWSALDWRVTPLQSLSDRAEREREFINELKK